MPKSQKVVRDLALLCVCLLSGGCSLLYSTEDAASSQSAACSSLAPLHDDFSNPTPLSKWRPYTGSSEVIIRQEAGEAIFDFAETTTTVRGSLTSYFEHDLRGNAFTVEVNQVAPEGVLTYIKLTTGKDSGAPVIELAHDAGELTFEADETVLDALDYDAARDRFWRIREGFNEQGLSTIFFETGPTLAEMEVRRETMVYGDFLPAHAAAAFGVSSSNVIPGYASFGSVNQDVKATGYCAAHTLVDSFDGELSPRWQQHYRSDRCVYECSEGALVISADYEGFNCTLGSYQAISLVDSELELRFSPEHQVTEGSISLDLSRGDDELSFTVNPDSVQIGFTAAGMSDLNANKKVSGLRSIRLRNEGDKVLWEVEADSIDGEPAEGRTIIDSQNVGFSISALSVSLTTDVGESLAVRASGINAD